MKVNAAKSEPLVGWWLIAICVCVLAMVMVGGATRLTHSGLSITQWNLEKGLVPPLTVARWNEEFQLYQRTTEYQVQNRGMSMARFQYIYWWEWTHRFIGKMIGLVFALPFFGFWTTGRLRGRFWPVLGLFALGGLQGFVGWWMVTSGLFGRLEVSPERLATHLGVAFCILGVALWLALDAFGWDGKGSKLGAPRWAPAVLIGLVFVQVVFGALLAGDHGGLAYTDWPTIGRQWIPSTAFGLKPFLANFTQDHATQQLLHRTTGYVVALSALTIAGFALLRGDGRARATGLALGVVALLQMSLGVITLISVTPLPLALAHQFGAALLWLTAVATLKASTPGGIDVPLSQVAETTREIAAT
jgi:cytochrome c oxidase assembly protein subunit 15